MRYLSFGVLIACLLLLVSACGEDEWDGNTIPNTGVLVKWSEQEKEKESKKKIIFIHGLNMGAEDYQGSIVQKVERDFDLKLMNLNSLGSEYFGKKTTELVEYWFYIYNTQQDVEKIAYDLAGLISGNGKFKNAQIALVGHSQGGVVAWLIDQQRYDLISGGVILGAPILSTPLADKEILGKALNDVYPIAGESIKNGLALLAERIEHLNVSYLESGQAKSNLLFMVGSIGIPSKDALSRNWALMEIVLNEGDYLVGNASSKRKLLEVGSLLIDSADWGDCKAGNCFSDGAVPVCSAVPNPEANMMEWEDYDHEELLSGKGDLYLDRATLQHLGKVLDLFPKFVEVPELVSLPEIKIFFSQISAWDWLKFTYVADGQLFVIDENWHKKQLVYPGQNYYPRFGSGNYLAWTNLNDEGVLNVYLLQEDDVLQIGPDNSKYANFSPSGEELVYQDGGNLAIYTIASGEYRAILLGVNLIAPPVWVKNDIYFANQDMDETISLYSIKPSANRQSLTGAKLIEVNCSAPFTAPSPFNGMAVISNIDNSHQSITVVLDWWVLSYEVSVDMIRSNVFGVERNGKEIVLHLPIEFRFKSMVYDTQYDHLYLIGSAPSDYAGLWLLDINRIINSSNFEIEEVFYSVPNKVLDAGLEHIESVDIKLAE